MFRDFSWFSVLLGMHFDFDQPSFNAALLRKMDAVLQQKRKRVERLLVKLPNHYHHLKEHVYRAGLRDKPKSDLHGEL